MLIQNGVDLAEKRLKKGDVDTARALLAVIDPPALEAVHDVLGNAMEQPLLSSDVSARLKKVEKGIKKGKASDK